MDSLQAVTTCGFLHPTPIQSSCIPVALAGKDVCACAATGTGLFLGYMAYVFRFIYSGFWVPNQFKGFRYPVEIIQKKNE